MKKFPISLICGIAAIMLTILLFFGIFNNVVLQAIHFITLSGMVLAEIITTAYAMYSQGNPRKVAAAVVSALMVPVSVLLSVVYIINFPLGYATYIIWYFTCTVLFNTIALILICFNSNKHEENIAFQNAKANILNMRKQIKCILADPAAEPYATRLNALEEDLHYTNDSVIVPADTEIFNLLTQLQIELANSDFDKNALLAKLELLVQQRKIMTSKTV